jgi:hypothetical protein
VQWDGSIFWGNWFTLWNASKLAARNLCAYRLVINHQAQKALSPLKGRSIERPFQGGLPSFVLSARRFIVGRADKAECQPIMNHPSAILEIAIALFHYPTF